DKHGEATADPDHRGNYNHPTVKPAVGPLRALRDYGISPNSALPTVGDHSAHQLLTQLDTLEVAIASCRMRFQLPSKVFDEPWTATRSGRSSWETNE
ncbi:MAG: hypothetical protein ABSE43_16600, partial [Steroidobacteraceae bacterium]